MYLLRTVDFKQTSKQARREQRWVEFTLYVIVIIIAFVSSVFAFRGAGYEATFSKETVTIDDKGIENSTLKRSFIHFLQSLSLLIAKMSP